MDRAERTTARIPIFLVLFICGSIQFHSIAASVSPASRRLCCGSSGCRRDQRVGICPSGLQKRSKGGGEGPYDAAVTGIAFLAHDRFLIEARGSGEYDLPLLRDLIESMDLGVLPK